MKYFLSFFLLIFSRITYGQQEIDSSRWNELGSRIAGCTIIGLGETGHGYESINEAKSIVAAVLRSQMNFKAIAFESSFVQSLTVFLRRDSLQARASGFLYPFWNTGSITAILHRFAEAERQTGKPLIMGFDVQEDCRFVKFSAYLLDEGLIVDNKEKLMECDSILSYYIGKNARKRTALTETEYEILAGNYDKIRPEIEGSRLDNISVKLLVRAIDNRKWLCRYLTFTTARQKMYFRDSLMADNIQWMKQMIYEEQKMIVWAANTHIAKQKTNKDPQWMGEWLSRLFGEQYFAIAFEKGEPGTGSHIIMPELSIKFTDIETNRFDATVNSGKLRKIRSDQWNTPCE